MPKQIPQKELDAIVAAVAAQPGGMQVTAILEGLPGGLEKRTLQRRLALLVAQKRLIAEGKGKSRRYLAPVAATGAGSLTARHAMTEGRGEVYVPLSPEGEEIRQTVRAPVQHRQPVGYRRDFLDDYRPNVTYYLPTETRRRLLEIGRPSDGERPAGTYARAIYSRLLIDLSWNSSRLEGNTYSLLETERLLDLGEAVEGKGAREAQMILNHKAAIELLVDQADEIGFNRYTILNLHALLAENLLADPQAGGRLRHGLSSVGAAAAYRGMLRNHSGYRGRDCRSVRAGLLRPGAPRLLAGFRRRQQACVPPGREYSIDPREPLPPVLRGCPGTSLYRWRAGSL